MPGFEPATRTRRLLYDRAVRARWWLVCLVGCGRVAFDGGDAPDGPPPSCAGQPMCGPALATSCCDSPVVIGGSFYRVFDVALDGLYPDRSFPATVSTFRLDRYEVTVGRFRKFVEEGLGTQANPPPAGAGARMLNGMANQRGWDPMWNASLAADTAALRTTLMCDPFQTWTDMPAANENRSIGCVSWLEAMAFCAWDGGFLPTEAEWNYAASGGDEQRAYAWSSPAESTTIDCTNT